MVREVYDHIFHDLWSGRSLTIIHDHQFWKNMSYGRLLPTINILKTQWSLMNDQRSFWSHIKREKVKFIIFILVTITYNHSQKMMIITFDTIADVDVDLKMSYNHLWMIVSDRKWSTIMSHYSQGDYSSWCWFKNELRSLMIDDHNHYSTSLVLEIWISIWIWNVILAVLVKYLISSIKSSWYDGVYQIEHMFSRKNPRRTKY